jgi:hypothetical protein
MKLYHFPGPLSLLRGDLNGGDIEKAAEITARYSKAKDLSNVVVVYKKVEESDSKYLIISPATQVDMEEFMICERT